jgi:streptogramin lyase
LDGEGYVLVATGERGASRIVRIDPITGAQTEIAIGSLLDGPGDITLEADGSILASTLGNRIVRIDPVSGSQTQVATGGVISAAVGLSVLASGGAQEEQGPPQRPMTLEVSNTPWGNWLAGPVWRKK